MKAGYFIFLAVVLFGIFILGMRHNNITVHVMKADLLERDRSGEDVRSEVEGELRDFAFSHMNASVAIMLEGAYAEAVAASEAAVDLEVDGSVYEAAVRECERDRRHVTENARCVQEYVDRRSGEIADTPPPDRAEFSYTFHSPKWTPDIAGIALLGAMLSAVMALGLQARSLLRQAFKR